LIRKKHDPLIGGSQDVNERPGSSKEQAFFLLHVDEEKVKTNIMLQGATDQ